MPHPRTILIAAGASGGHLFPALAVAEELRAQGATCIFVVGGTKFAEKVTEAGFVLERLPASAFNVANPMRKLKALLNVGRGFVQALRLLGRYQPSAVFATGGYASVALVLAAKVFGVPVVLHEGNVLPGRATKLLCRLADTMLLTFAGAHKHLPCAKAVVQVTGNPIRSAMVQGLGLKRKDDKTLTLLITGGSQGSAILSEVIPQAIARLEPKLLKRLRIHHQARAADVPACEALYKTLPLASFTVEPFIANMAQALTQAHVVLARAGTSTVVETALFGRAAIYIPLELADGHQMLNAQVAEEAGAAIIIPQGMFSAETLLPHLTNLLTDQAHRTHMEDNARALFNPHAAHTVAEIVLDTAKKDLMTQAH
ncbi:MAG: UDP-N-acetylglucosamine--N-acetylmuramyl-(pentapeptide) pyrophosphoryl-undecaprenol N-acetylglucosamine transferase [Alphaproteobacteria bacterium]